MTKKKSQEKDIKSKLAEFSKEIEEINMTFRNKILFEENFFIMDATKNTDWLMGVRLEKIK